MRQATTKALYGLHSWIGVALGLLLYVVCFSGVVALFSSELGPWLRGDHRTSPPLAAVNFEQAIAATLRQAAVPAETGARSQLELLLPTDYRPWLTVLHTAGGRTTSQSFDPQTAEPVTHPDGAANEVLTRLHTDLLLPSPYGRYLLGGLGIIWLLSVVAGVLLHRKMIAELFTLRLHRSPRLRWTDLHKSIGLWGLPFHLIIVLTGAVLGVSGFALMLSAAIAFKGDLDSAFVALSGAATVAESSDVPLRPVAELLAVAQTALPGLRPAVVVVDGYGGPGPQVQVMGNVRGRLVYYPMVSIDGGSGRVTAVTDWSRDSLIKQLYAMVTPLHYASFGGVWLKLLYALLGAGTVAVVVSGMGVWRARAMNARPDAVLRTFDGVFHGLPCASTILLIAGRILPRRFAADYDVMVIVFLVSCGLCLAWPWLRGRDAAARELLALTALALLLAPVLGLLASEQPIHLLFAPAPLLAVDLSALVLGGGLVLIWLKRWGSPLNPRR